MAQEDDNGTEVNEALEILGMIFIAHHQAAKVKQPAEESLYLPPAAVTSGWIRG